MAEGLFSKWARPEASPEAAPTTNLFAKWAAQPDAPEVSTASDVLQSAGAGLRRGFESIPGMGGDIPALGRGVISKVAGYLGAAPETQQAITDYDIPYAPNLPTTEDIHGVTSKFVGDSYEPQTTAGKYARTAGEFAPAFIGNPLAGVGRTAARVALGAGAGLASEAAGQATEGTAAEPWARAGAGILAGATGHGVTAGTEGAITAPGRAAEVAAEDAALQHGVRLTKGQRTGNVTQQTAEEQMLHGARGDAAQRMMQGRRDANQTALTDAMEATQDRVAPTRGADPVQAGDLLNQSVRDRVARLRDTGGQQIEGALNSGVMIDADHLRGLTGNIERNLAGNTPYVPDVVLGPDTPVANSAMERMRTFASQAEDPNVREFSLAGGEQLRRHLVPLSAMPGTPDARALGRIKEHFDDWLENAVGSTGNVGTIQDLQQGRATYREGARIDQPRGAEKRRPGAGDVSKIARDNHPEDTRRLFTPTASGRLSGQATDALQRLQETGANSRDLDQIRGIVLDHLSAGFPQRRANRVTTFLAENPTAAEMLFSPAERRRLQGWADTNRRLIPNPEATNPSRTSYPMVKEMSKQASKQATTLLGTIGGAMGGWLGAGAGVAAGGVSSLIKEIGNRRAAGQALSPADRRTLAAIIAQGAGKGALRGGRGSLGKEDK